MKKRESVYVCSVCVCEGERRRDDVTERERKRVSVCV